MKVLVVDDDLASRELLKISCIKQGYDCITAEDGMKGLEAFQTYMPDVVISDVRMPNMDGMTLLEKLRSFAQDVIIIIITGHGNEELALRALELGANNYIKKPLDLTDLKTQLKRYKSYVESRCLENYISDFIVDRTMELVIETDLHLSPPTARFLVNKTGTYFDDKSKIGLELGLSEIITNAIEHGNLEITHEDKSNALSENKLQDLYLDRLSQPQFQNRKVYIEFSLTESHCQWIIRDEGKGFNFQKLSFHSESNAQAAMHGRGIFISKIQFDKVEYLGNGNSVKLIKYKK
ncbi:MAG: response regulator [Bacteroidales bacterium]|nr:response regulator [Bacteroidales bacterium]